MDTAPSRTGLLLLTLALLGCAKTLYFILPSAEQATPTAPRDAFITAACEEAPRRVLVRTSGVVRAYGPLTVATFVPEAKGKVEKRNDAKDCDPRGFCTLKVQEGGVLEVGVGKLEQAGNEWGFLCFSDEDGSEADCVEPTARLDVRVTCPSTRFAKQEAPGVMSQPLQAHLPVELTCRGTPPAFTCTPSILLLTAGVPHVHGALTSPGAPQRVEALAPVPFAPAGAPGKDGTAFICLDGACANPAYHLPLHVTFEGAGHAPPAAPDAGTGTDGGTPPDGGAG
jgi:hypothetical protein